MLKPDPLSDFLISLAAGLTQSLIEASARRIRLAFTGDERQQALQAAIAEGLARALKGFSLSKDERDHLNTVLTEFFQRSEVVDELAQLLEPRPGNELNMDLLLKEFREAGYEPGGLPGFSFEEFMACFVRAFYSAASHQKDLQGVIEIGLLSKMADQLEELCQIDKRSANALERIEKRDKQYSAPEPDALRIAYLNRLFESAGRLSLSGIDPKAASEAEARLSLSAVYTALLTQSYETYEQEQSKDRYSPVGVTVRPQPLSALEHLDRQPRLVLLGDPGSGKSTFVNFVSLCLAGEALGSQDANLELLTAPLPHEEGFPQEEEPKPQPWSHGALLPVRVVLRDFAARGDLPEANQKASADDLWRFIVAELGKALSDYSPYLRRELLERGGLLLLDGLDEVPEAESRRMQIRQAVEEFSATFPNCRVLVTSRTYAYQKQDWRLQNFAEAVLAPFSRGQIRQFIEHWYGHIAELRGMEAQDARGRAELLLRAVFHSDRLYALAERPLLLTLMASLHAWRGGTLPEKREELYADTVNLLLDWWESPKVVHDSRGEVVMRQPSLAEWLKVDRQKVRESLNEIAFRAHSAQTEFQGTADVLESDLVSRMMRLSQNPEVNPTQLVEYLSVRAGLLLPRGVGVYTFPHRTFQEYLAACYLTDHEYPEQIADLARSDPNRWREVALLAGAKAARGTASAIWSLADALCFREPGALGSNREDAWGALLAGQALVETADLTRISPRNISKADRIRRWQVNIIESGELPALERAAAGNTLASLGDPRFRADRWYLPDEPLLGFVEIPAGAFRMGSDPKQDKSAYDAEKPQHKVYLPTYYLARYPVTVAQFRAFVEDRGYDQASEHSLRGADNHPVAFVSWYDAMAYCDWLTEKLKEFAQKLIHSGDKALEDEEADFWKGLAQGRFMVKLPSEAEWEKAARGTDGRIYPWGEVFDPDKANTDETGLGSTSAVGCFPGGASPYGLLDLSGNLWEWTRSLWGKDFNKPDFKYPYDPKDGREDLKAEGLRVVRGGAFFYGAVYARSVDRFRDLPGSLWDHYGFRVGVCGAAYPGS